MRHTYLGRAAAVLALAITLVAGFPESGASEAQRKKSAKNAPAAQGIIDETYTAKIREYTTEKFFLTELVDHLPASDRVPSPDKVLGYVIGTPEKLTHTADIYRYMRALEKASPRVRVFTIGRSDEDREVLAVAVSDEANLARLDRVKEINARLADPRKLKDDAEAAALIAETRPIYWMSGSIHSPETGSPEMLWSWPTGWRSRRPRSSSTSAAT